MATKSYPDVIRGRLTPVEIEQIAALADRGFGAGRIALKLNRHPGTVNYAMHRLGYRKMTRRAGSYVRNGVVVKPFSAEEDDFVQAHRAQGLTTTKIAELCSERFGHGRSPHTINVRLVMLASAAEFAAAAA